MHIAKIATLYWSDILLVVAIFPISYAAYNWYVNRFASVSNVEKIAMAKRVLKMLYPFALQLVTDAEVNMIGKHGSLKRAWVLKEMYALIPDQIKPLVTEDNLSEILELALEQAKKSFSEFAATQQHKPS